MYSVASSSETFIAVVNRSVGTVLGQKLTGPKMTVDLWWQKFESVCPTKGSHEEKMQGGGGRERQRETGRSLSAFTTTNLDFHPNGFCKTSVQNATGYKSLMQRGFFFFYSVGE